MSAVAKHTPTPWLLDRHNQLRGPDGSQVNVWGLGIGWASRDENTEANSDLIVRAVNAHDELLTGLRTIANDIEGGMWINARGMIDDLLAKHGGCQ